MMDFRSVTKFNKSVTEVVVAWARETITEFTLAHDLPCIFNGR